MTTIACFNKTAGIKKVLVGAKDILSGKSARDMHTTNTRKFYAEAERRLKFEPKGAKFWFDKKEKKNIVDGWTDEGVSKLDKYRLGLKKLTSRENYKRDGARGTVGAAAISATAYAASKDR